MSEETDRLYEEEQALLAQLARIREAKNQALMKEAEEKKKLELLKPVIVRVSHVDGLSVMSRLEPWREDVFEVFKNTPNRSWNGTSNLVPVGTWFELVEKLTGSEAVVQNVTIAYNNGTEELIKKRINEPKYLVEVLPNDEGIKITPGYRQSLALVTSKLQWKWASGNEAVIIPTYEAWNISEAFNQDIDHYDHVKREYITTKVPTQGVVYTAEAAQLIEDQITERSKLDTLTKEEDCPWIDAELKAVGWIFPEPLRPFQRVDIEFGKKTGGRFILANPVGLGKSLTALAVSKLIGSKQTLISCPAGLIPNWKREIEKCFGKKNVAVLKGSKMQNWILDLITHPEYIIVSHDTLGKKVEVEKLVEKTDGYDTWHSKEIEITFPVVDFLIKMVPIDYVIGDEGHYWKNENSNRSQGARRLALNIKAKGFTPMTGHPVVNRVPELWPLLNMVAPGQFGSAEKFEDRYWDPYNKRPKNLEELHKNIKHLFIRRKKEDVIKELPPVNRIVQYHDLSEKAREKYADAEAGFYEAIAEFDPDGIGGNPEDLMSILTKILRLKQIVAMDKAKGRTPDFAIELLDSLEDDDPYKKIIIFTQFKGTAYEITRRLGQRCLGIVTKLPAKKGKKKNRFATAAGEERDAIIEQFKSDPNIDILVLTEKAASEGLNITQAGYMIFNDLFWTPKAHEQCEGRAHGRLADSHGLDSYYFVTENSIENQIMSILANKFEVIRMTVDEIDKARISDTSIIKEMIRAVKKLMWVR